MNVKPEDMQKMRNTFFFQFTRNISAVFVLFSLIAFYCVSVQGDDDTEEGWENTVEVTKTVDNDDIEEKVDSGPVKIAQEDSGNKGIVWGKSKKAKELEKNDEAKKTDKTASLDKSKESAPKPLVNIDEEQGENLKQAEKTMVRRPVSATPLPEKSIAAKQSEAAPGERFLLKSNRKKGSTDLVETLLEVTGDVKELDNEQKAKSDKMEVVAGFRYEERVDRFSLSTDSLVSVRQYNLAKAKMKIADDIKTPELDDKLQTIVCRLEGDKVSLFSPKGSLRGEQLLLIEDLPGNTLTLDRLLPNKEVKIGDSWKVSDSVLRSFLSVDSINESSVEAVLTAVADNMAMVEVVGDINAMYLGASTEMSVRAKYQFDLESKRINWLGLLIEENRSIGHVGPGLDLVARLQVKISPIEGPQSLTGDFLDTVNLTPNDTVMQLKYDGGKGPWRFSHGRDWYVYQDDPQTTIIRKLHNNELVAQCNVADMGKVDPKTMTTLDKFQKDLETGLGKSFGKIVAAEQREHKNGYKIYTVLIDGVVEELALRWIYNLMTDKNGQQVVVVFVVEADMLEQFADADEVLLETFKIGKK